MSFAATLNKYLRQQGISQIQLSRMTGLPKSTVSEYLSGVTVPSRERQHGIASCLGVPTTYFDEQTESVVSKILPEDAARILGIGEQTVRKGLQQGVFPWGYAVQTSAERWTYIINEKKFKEIERI